MRFRVGVAGNGDVAPPGLVLVVCVKNAPEKWGVAKMGLQLKMCCDKIRAVLGKQGMNNRFEFTRFYYFGFSRRSGLAYA